MNEKTLKVHYIIDGKIKSIETTQYYSPLDDGEYQNVSFELKIDEHCIRSKASDSFEYAIKFLQKELPTNMRIACCQSCRFGHFNPYGDLENEIFCLKGMTPRNREEVVGIFATEDESLQKRSRELLYYCNDYKPITDKTYSYNDWEA